MKILLLSLVVLFSTFANASEPYIEKLKFNCSKKANISNIFVEGQAQLDALFEGTVELNYSEDVLHEETGQSKLMATAELKYHYNINWDSAKFGNLKAEVEGNVTNYSTVFYFTDDTAKVSISKEDRPSLFFILSGDKKLGWSALVYVWFDPAKTSKDFTATMFSQTIACAVTPTNK